MKPKRELANTFHFELNYIKWISWWIKWIPWLITNDGIGIWKFPQSNTPWQKQNVRKYVGLLAHHWSKAGWMDQGNTEMFQDEFIFEKQELKTLRVERRARLVWWRTVHLVPGWKLKHTSEFWLWEVPSPPTRDKLPAYCQHLVQVYLTVQCYAQ